MADKRAVAEVMAVIAESYPNFRMTDNTITVYHQLLHDIPEDELKAAVLLCLSEKREFAPPPGVVRGKVAEIRAREVPSDFEAWSEVSRLATYSRSGKLEHKWSHPLVEKAAKLMGFPKFMQQTDTLMSDRARFLECYGDLVAKASRSDLQLPEVRAYLEASQPKLLADVLGSSGVDASGAIHEGPTSRRDS